MMSKHNGSPKSAAIAAELVEEVVNEIAPAAPVMTVVKSETEEAPRKLTLDEKFQWVEDLTLLIERYRTLIESRRKLQTFPIGTDSLSSTINLRDGVCKEFKTFYSAVISAVIDEMKSILDTKVCEVEEQINLS